ncbi:MAG TPA: M23 family metallopeptidase [Candidatus Saccharimonadales bacterium]|nr:M23 family metallopeptidase [Candidatus Saccharimonadales bacterium]
MIEFTDTFLYKLRILSVVLLIVASLSLLPLMFSAFLKTPKVQAAHAGSTNTTTTTVYDDPNVVTVGLTNAADGLAKVANSAEQAINNSFHVVTDSIVLATTQSGKFVAHSVGDTVAFVTHATTSTVGFIANTSKASAIIRPAEADKNPVPFIDSDTVVVADNHPAKPASIAPAASQAQVDSAPQWPIHGTVTTEFGVPHWPYQPTHTGIDISDMLPSGITPIHPFKPGKVIETVHSNVGFGNHVVIDHGGGITSLYGHLASISVHVGQQVDKSAVLGYEGSTGASTGTHLHFEIRLNGQPVNPRLYVSGQP